MLAVLSRSSKLHMPKARKLWRCSSLGEGNEHICVHDALGVLKSLHMMLVERGLREVQLPQLREVCTSVLLAHPSPTFLPWRCPFKNENL